MSRNHGLPYVWINETVTVGGEEVLANRTPAYYMYPFGYHKPEHILKVFFWTKKGEKTKMSNEYYWQAMRNSAAHVKVKLSGAVR